MAQQRSYRDLLVWQKAMELVEDVYKVTFSFPKEEIYGMTSQMRRCAISVPSNIAEGQGRLTKGEFRQFLGQARGSLFELQTQVEIARALGFIDKLAADVLANKATEMAKLLHGLMRSLAESKN